MKNDYIKRYIIAIDYTITGVATCAWGFEGTPMFYDNDSAVAHISACVEPTTQKLFQITVADTISKVFFFRWINPAYRSSYFDQHKKRLQGKSLVFDIRRGEVESIVLDIDSFDEIIHIIEETRKGKAILPKASMTLSQFNQYVLDTF